MAMHLENGSLIQSLQRLYSRMVLFALHNRNRHGKHRAVSHRDREIGTPLYDYIDSIAGRVEASGEPDKPLPSRPGVTNKAENTPHQSDAVPNHPSISGKPRALARYFDSYKAATLLVPEVGKKLKDRTWEHLHEAIRFGRMGDIKNAKLHADLANGSLKEAIRYMSRDDFEVFLGEIERKFDEVLAESKH